MASKTVLKAARPSEFPETDPLAELSRIMGLAKEEAAANSSEADFGIDLEQELMGELFGKEPAADVEARAPQPEEGATEFETLQADFDDAFADMLSETAEEQASEPVAATVETDVDLQAMEVALGDDLADLDAAFEDFDLAAGMDEEVSAHIEQDAVDAEVDDTVGQILEGMAVADHIDDVDHVAEEEYVADEGLAAEEDFAADDIIEDFAAFVDDDAVIAEAEAEIAPQTVVADEVELRAEAPEMVAQPAAVAPAPSKPLSIEDELRQLLGRTGNAHVLPQSDAVSAISEEVAEAEASAVEAAASDDTSAYHPEPTYEEPADFVAVEETAAEEVVAAAEEEVTADMPAFDDFAFDQADLDHDDLAAELEQTLAGGEAEAVAVAETDEEQQFADAEMAFDPAERQLEAAAEVDDDPVIDLEAELAPYIEPQPMTRETAGPSTEAKPATLRPLTFTEERRAVAQERPAAPVFDWRQRYAEMKSVEAGRSEPVAERAAPVPAAPDLDDADPFAALAALAAQPPIVRSLSRSNPVANPNATARETLRPVTVAPAPSAAPIAAEPAAGARPDFSSWRTQAAPQREVAAAAPVPVEPPRAEAPRPAAPYAAPKSDMPLAPRAGLAASAAGGAAASAFAPAPAAAKPAPQPQQVEDEFPDLADLLDDANFAPDIETVEISDQAVALADELDIPDFAFDEPNVTPVGFDDLDADFATAFQQLSRVPEPKPTPSAARSVAQPDPGAGYYVERAPEPARAAYPNQYAAQPTQYAPVTDYDDQLAGFQLDQGGEPPYAEDDDAFAGDFYGEEMEKEQPKRSRGLLIAALLASVAVIGGIGAYAFTGGSVGDGAPALVKADPSPIKVKPENPGGAIVPNQDGKVYEQVRGQPAAAPSQNKLVSGAEEPIAPPPAARPAAPAVDTATNPPAAAEQPTAALPGVETPTVKSEERVTPEETAQGSSLRRKSRRSRRRRCAP
ncbi:hypothetical protein [Mesorhizobium sp. J428]|uniref:hypothetical protein n=1 Tax=Mesorhizobium sp. J428 TaxID=2898440 RepID=UPI002151F0A8|nr:hypothetical protein [Mesorhizobium sp. J428]MCR5859902.1 hypothetical protein [Mesorhizobium sp. J428]